MGQQVLGGKKGRVRSILLALSFRVKKVKKYVVYYLPIVERILCVILGFFQKTDSARYEALFSPATPKFNFRFY